MSMLYQEYPTPDGLMFAGPHAQTSAENMQEGTVSSVYCIENGGEVCLVDTGRHEAMYQHIVSCIKQHGWQLRYIVLTHDHYDHVGNANAVQQTCGGEIIAHALDVPLITNPLLPYDAHSMEQLYGRSMHQAWQEMNVPPSSLPVMQETVTRHYCDPQTVNRPIQTDTTIDLNGLAIQLLHTPGHSPGSLTVHVPATKSVYTGDMTFWVNPCRPYPIGNEEHCVASLRRVHSLSPAYCGPGHYIGIDNPCTWLNGLIHAHIQLQEQVLGLLDTPRTVAEIRSVVFPKDPEDSFAPIPENSIHAVLVYLCSLSKATPRLRSGSVVWEKCITPLNE